MDNTRRIYLDNIRWITVCIVAIYHVIYMYNGVQPVSYTHLVAAVISGLIFGIYHGNMVQGIYASILGTAFAWILEMSGNIYSSMLLHMGANIWSLVITEYALDMFSMKYGVQILILIYLILLASVVYCLTHFEKMYSVRKKKRMI